MAISYALTLPAGYWTVESRNEHNEPCIALHHTTGWVSDHPDRADAIYAAQAREAEAAQAETVSVGMHLAREDVVQAALDLLQAIDRGYLNDGLRPFSDGTESAFIAALRQSVEPFQQVAQ